MLCTQSVVYKLFRDMHWLYAAVLGTTVMAWKRPGELIGLVVIEHDDPFVLSSFKELSNRFVSQDNFLNVAAAVEKHSRTICDVSRIIAPNCERASLWKVLRCTYLIRNCQLLVTSRPRPYPTNTARTFDHTNQLPTGDHEKLITTTPRSSLTPPMVVSSSGYCSRALRTW